MYLAIHWDVGEKRIALRSIIDPTAVVAQTVADNQIIDAKYKVVTTDLVEDLLRDFHRGSFVFHDDARRKAAVIDHRIATARHPVQLQLHLVCHQGRRIVLLVRKKVDEVLTYPFFGSQSDVTPANKVENALFLSL